MAGGSVEDAQPVSASAGARVIRSARAYRNNWPDYGPPAEPLTDLPLFRPQSPGEAARDRVVNAFQQFKADTVKALRAEAHRRYAMLGRPISANDVRHVLRQFPGVDARILVAAFPLTEWEIVGETKHNAPRNHARRIRTYQPRGT